MGEAYVSAFFNEVSRPLLGGTFKLPSLVPGNIRMEFKEKKTSFFHTLSYLILSGG